MKHSTERFLTTHTGSLPRPDDLVRLMYAKEEGVPVDAAALAARVRAAVLEVVQQATRGRHRHRQRRRNVASRATRPTSRTGSTASAAPATRSCTRIWPIPATRQARVRRSRALAPQDAGLQRADQRARRRAAQADVDNLKAALGAA